MMGATMRASRQDVLHQELDRLVTRIHRGGAASLTFEEIERLSALYRLATCHLAQLRASGWDPQRAARIEALVARAHAAVYQPTRSDETLLDFYTRGFPRAFRETAGVQALAAAITVAAGLLAFLAVLGDPERVYSLVGAFYSREALHALVTSGEAREALTTVGRGAGFGEKAAFATMLLTHNAQVGFMAFATGALAGIPTVLLDAYNGALLGALAGIFHRGGLSAPLWAWILPHGVTELWAVFICSAAGLHLGGAVLDPGRRTRRRALRERAPTAVRLVLGTLPMFVFAGLVESYVRQSHLGMAPRYAFAGATFAFWIGYFGWCGADRPPRPRLRRPPPAAGLAAAAAVICLLATPAVARAASPVGTAVCGDLHLATQSEASALPGIAAPFLGAARLLDVLGVSPEARGGPWHVVVARTGGGLEALPHPYARPGRRGAVTPGPTGIFALLLARGGGGGLRDQAREAAAETVRLALDRAYGPLPPWLETGLGSVAASLPPEPGVAVLPPPPFPRLAEAGSRLRPAASLGETPWEPQRDPHRWFTAWVLSDWLVRDAEAGRPALLAWLRDGGAREPLLQRLARERPDLDIRLGAHAREPAPALPLGAPPPCVGSTPSDARREAREALAALSLLKLKRDGSLGARERRRVESAARADDAGDAAAWALAWTEVRSGLWEAAEARLRPLAEGGVPEAQWLLALALQGGRGAAELAAEPTRAAEAARHAQAAAEALPWAPSVVREAAALCAVVSADAGAARACAVVATAPPRAPRSEPVGAPPGLADRDRAWLEARAR